MNPLTFFELSGTSYILLPLLLLPVIGVLFIPSLLAGNGAKPEEIGRGIIYYILQSLGIVLLGSAVLAVLPNLFSYNISSIELLYVPLLFFLAGIWLLVHFANETVHLDKKAIQVTRAIFLVSFELIGIVFMVLSVFTIIIDLLAIGTLATWETPAAFLVAGILLASGCNQAITGNSKPAASTFKKRNVVKKRTTTKKRKK